MIQNKTRPKISIIMSVYNGEKYLAKSIQSILDQSVTDFEFIIINDASTDRSDEIIKTFVQKDKRIITVENDSNIGLTKSLNIGIRLARGNYIARQDADDISLPDRLKKQYFFMEKNRNIFLCGTMAIIIDDNENVLAKTDYLSDTSQIKKRLRRGNCLIHFSIMFRNKNIFYRDKFKYSQDYDLYLNLLTMGHNIAVLNEALVKSRFNLHAISFEKNSQQELFAKKAKTFYIQRMNKGSDDYDSFDPNEILNKNNLNPERILLRKKIELYLRTGRYDDARLHLLEYNKLEEINPFRLTAYKISVTLPFVYRIYRKLFYS
ncbi:MAG: glycosyltransferase family 2 protein [bacterium]